MKIALDWDTVITTDVDMWSAFVKEAQFRGHWVMLTITVDEPAPYKFAEHLGIQVFYVGVDQAQDVLGPDIWVHGRLDRVVSHHVAEHVLNG